MFVRQSTYESVSYEYARVSRDLNTAIATIEQYKREFHRITTQWNELAERINRKGGETFLEHGTLAGSLLNVEDIQKLIMLCHPDKHGGKLMATEMTQKLIELKESLK